MSNGLKTNGKRWRMSYCYKISLFVEEVHSHTDDPSIY